MIRVDEEQDCPTNDYTPGEAGGTCWGDGHYMCNDCQLFRADFKKDITLRDRVLDAQGGIQFDTLKPLPVLSV